MTEIAFDAGAVGDTVANAKTALDDAIGDNKDGGMSAIRALPTPSKRSAGQPRKAKTKPKGISTPAPLPPATWRPVTQKALPLLGRSTPAAHRRPVAAAARHVCNPACK